MIPSDNIFYGNGFGKTLKAAAEVAENGKATIFGYYVKDLERFGIVEFDKEGNVLSVEEKTKEQKSNYCITGLYFYPAGISKMAKEVKPSARGELEITMVNDMFLKAGNLKVNVIDRGMTWFDTGTMESLLEVAEFIHMIEDRQCVIISAPEEIAYRFGWIDEEQLMASAEKY